MKKISLLMITKNSDELIDKSLKSVKGLIDEIILVDNGSTDDTCAVARKYRAKIYQYHGADLGRKRLYGLTKARNEWILVLDSDEIISNKLKKEIKELKYYYDGFLIPHKKFFLGRPINHGGENYKLLRLFKKDKIILKPALVHEKFILKSNKLGCLRNKIYHYSYRSIAQVFKKFTDYAIRDAKQKKIKGEKTSLKKIILYPIHMFWARFVEDKGYKDGLFRIPLDLGFAYMEFLTYLLMLF